MLAASSWCYGIVTAALHLYTWDGILSKHMHAPPSCCEAQCLQALHRIRGPCTLQQLGKPQDSANVCLGLAWNHERRTNPRCIHDSTSGRLR